MFSDQCRSIGWPTGLGVCCVTGSADVRPVVRLLDEEGVVARIRGVPSVTESLVALVCRAALRRDRQVAVSGVEKQVDLACADARARAIQVGHDVRIARVLIPGSGVQPMLEVSVSSRIGLPEV